MGPILPGEHIILHTRRSSAARDLRNQSRSDENMIIKMLALLKAGTKLGFSARQDSVLEFPIIIKPDVFLPSPLANIKKSSVRFNLKSQ